MERETPMQEFVSLIVWSTVSATGLYLFAVSMFCH